MHRRRVLQAGVGALLLPTLAGLSGCQTQAKTVVNARPSGQKLDAFGLQLSTVTPLMLADFEGTLASVAEVGYKQVEFSAMGFLGRPVGLIEKLLADNGLSAPVGRVTPKLPEGFFSLSQDQAMAVFRERGHPDHLLENVSHSLDSAVALGQKYLVLPALMPDTFATLDDVKRNIDVISAAGELCAKSGVQFGYHNHNWEFVTVDGVVPYELMLSETDPQQVTFQLDVYWVEKAGASPADLLSRHAGRFVTVHMKDIAADGDFADVGSGEIDFPAFTRQAFDQGARYFFVERDSPPDPASSIRNSYAYLSQMIF